MTLFYLSKYVTFEEISRQFNITKSSAHRIIGIIVEYFTQNSGKYIKWPENSEKTQTLKKFEEISGIEEIIGVLDSTQIYIKKPSEDATLYYNGEEKPSILLQAVCNARKKFTDVFCGEAGSLHPIQVLDKSPLNEKCTNGFLEDCFLIGSPTYPCLSWLITPFIDNEDLSNEQLMFNERLTDVQAVITDALSLLRCRFRHLNFFDNDISFITKCVVTTMVFHNICIDFDDGFEYESSSNSDMSEKFVVADDSASFTERRDTIFQKMFTQNI